jgi:hypothetical protein
MPSPCLPGAGVGQRRSVRWSLWLNSLVRSQRWIDLTRDSRTGPEALCARKYADTDTFLPDGRHAWLRITPEKLVSRDFRTFPRSGRSDPGRGRPPHPG